RHYAMLAGEAGADYVMFGEPDRNGRRPSFEEGQERLTWWADLFEIPCVAYAAAKEEVAALSRTGAVFIALGDWIWSAPEGAAEAITAAAASLERRGHDAHDGSDRLRTLGIFLGIGIHTVR